MQRGIAFRILSRMGRLVHKFLVNPATEFPVALFGILGDRTKAGSLQKVRRCMMDTFTAHFMSKFPGESLQDDAAYYSLYVLALTIFTENIGVEVGHTTMRRFIVS